MTDNWVAHHGLTSEEFQQRFDEYADQGYRFTHVSGYSVGSEARYAAIWEERDGPAWVARHGLTSSQYQNQFDGYVYQGYRLIGVSGYSVNSDARFAAIWETDGLDRSDIDTIDRHITNYKNQHGIPGLSVAITKDERLVFAKGYGDADRGANETVRPSHRFRIASISKPITAVATMELVESDELRLADTVFGSNGILRPKYGTPAYGSGISSPNPNSITVHHLLEHSSGWRNNGNDPMFDHPNKNQDELIRHVVGNRALQYEPGIDDEYLNFGYCVLGRVIEEVTGRPYEEYVEDAVLSACGIDRMGIAGTPSPSENPRKSSTTAGIRMVCRSPGWTLTAVGSQRPSTSSGSLPESTGSTGKRTSFGRKARPNCTIGRDQIVTTVRGGYYSRTGAATTARSAARSGSWCAVTTGSPSLPWRTLDRRVTDLQGNSGTPSIPPSTTLTTGRATICFECPSWRGRRARHPNR